MPVKQGAPFLLATLHIVEHEELKTSHVAIITSLQTVLEAQCWLSNQMSVGLILQIRQGDYFNKRALWFIYHYITVYS